MANMDKWIILGFMTTFFAIAASDKSPLLIWTNDENQEIPTPLAGHTTSHEKLWGDYLEGTPKKNNHNILLFLQDKLSLDDITKNADVYSSNSNGATFQHLKGIMESHQSTHFPSISSPGKLVELFRNHFDGLVHEVPETAESLSEVPLDREKRNLVLVHLPKTKNAGEAVLSKIDGILGKMTNDMKSLGKPFTALYTGQSSYAVQGEHFYQGRHLLAAATGQNYTWINYTCVNMYYANLNLSYTVPSSGSTMEWTLPQQPVVDGTKSVCRNDSSVLLTLNYADVGTELTGVIFAMEFKSSSGMWYLDSFNLTYAINANGTVVPTTTTSMDNRWVKSTPLDFSYHCYQGGKIKEANENTTKAYIEFTTLQVQAVKVGSTFGYANDCVGFFTITIWSGIITTVLLIAILAFGIGMLANITTMDRFDDPKGKTITVNVME